MKLFVAWSPVKPRCFLTAADGNTSCWVNTLSAIKLATVPYKAYFMYCCPFLAKPLRRAFCSSGSAFKMGIQAFVVQAVRCHCAKHYYPCWKVSHLLDGDFVTAKDQGYQRIALAQIQGGAEKFGSTLVSGLCGNLVCEGQMA